MKKKMNFEQAMQRLEEIAGQLDAGEVELDASITLYEEGSKLIKFCQEKLSDAEQKIQKLTQNEDGSFKTQTTGLSE